MAWGFTGFCDCELCIGPRAWLAGRVHISEVSKAFRLQYGKYRTSDQLSDDRFKSYFSTLLGGGGGGERPWGKLCASEEL